MTLSARLFLIAVLAWLVPAASFSLQGTNEARPDAAHATGSPMSQDKLEGLIRSVAPDTQGRPGAIQFTIGGVGLVCISDLAADRMRIISPIGDANQITEEQSRRMLEANFHTALDARYATSDGVLYAAFIHPLSSLSEGQLASAIAQVAMLAKTFGTHYSSGALHFGEPKTEL